MKTKPDVKKGESTQNLLKNLFLKNKNIVSFEMSGFTQDEKNLLELDDEIDPNVSMDEVYSKVEEADKLSIAANVMKERCSKKSSSKESYENGEVEKIGDGSLLIIDNDESKAEFNSTKFDDYTDAEKVINMSVGVVGTSIEDDSESIAILSKQYWTVVNEIFVKLRTASILIFKKVYSFINKDFNEIRAWYLLDGESKKEEICNNVDKKFMLKLPQVITFEQFDSVVEEELNNIYGFVDDVVYFYKSLTNGGSIEENEYKIKRIDSIYEKSAEFVKRAESISVDKMKKMLYNDGVPSFKETTAKDFFEKFDYELLGDSKVSSMMYDVKFTLSQVTQVIEVIKGLSDKIIMNDEYRKKVEATFNNFQTCYLKYESSYIWFLLLKMRNYKTAMMICKTILTHE